MNKAIKFSKKDNSVRYGRCVYHIELNNVELDVEVKNPMILEEWSEYYITSYEIVLFNQTHNGKGRRFYKLNEAKAFVRSDDFIKEIIEFKEEVLENIRKENERQEKFVEYVRTFYGNVLENCKGFSDSNEYNVGDEVELFSHGMKFDSLSGMVEDVRYYDERLTWGNSTKTRRETIVEIVEVSNEAYDEWLGEDLYNDDGEYFKWENMGGNFKGGVTMVKSPNRPNAFIDCQGYEYARYVYLEVDNFQKVLDFRKENYIDFGY